jgi:phosphatidate cytidylyltransferase
LVLVAVWAGGYWLAALVAIVSALGLAEFRRLVPGRSALGLLYIPLLLGHLVALRLSPFGLERTLGLLAVVWVSDIAQFFIGRAFGRHRLAPSTSPGKTVEGLWGGLLAAALVGWIGAGQAGLPNPGAGAALAFAVAAFGVAGDLFESHLKRRAGVKDSGSFLPGHGGVLDRFDSLLFAAPGAYWLLHLPPFVP